MNEINPGPAAIVGQVKRKVGGSVKIMRTVLLAAACTLCLAFSAHSAEAPDASLPPSPASATGCMNQVAAPNGSALTTDDDAEDCCASSHYCAQYLSTQILVQAPQGGHT